MKVIKMSELEPCNKCGIPLEYYERHYITEEKRLASVWCARCFKLELMKRTGKELKLTDFN